MYIIKIADEIEREQVYKMKYQVYVDELKQYQPNEKKILTDKLDFYNTYIIIKNEDKVIGFVSITPPGKSYSIDKYVDRKKIPFKFDKYLYEVRILTVTEKYRNSSTALMLIYASAKWIESIGGENIIILGRKQIKDVYKKISFEETGTKVLAGNVEYELMTTTITRANAALERMKKIILKIEKNYRWMLECSFSLYQPCFHGGNFYKSLDNTFNNLRNINSIISADVLDAWYDPCPDSKKILKENIYWLLKTSPPAFAEGLQKTIATKRKINEKNILTGNGSSHLIYTALINLLNNQSHVLLFTPSYGEYSHLCKNVIACEVNYYQLEKDKNFKVDINEVIQMTIEKKYNMICLVNPNNPTGQMIGNSKIKKLLNEIPEKTILWIDEAYLEYTFKQSSEELVAQHRNLIVCKSMSKVYALSGLRIGYLCGSEDKILHLKKFIPPWSVSLPGQMAAIKALCSYNYYQSRYIETHKLRNYLIEKLNRINGLTAVGGEINCVLVYLQNIPIQKFVDRCATYNLYIRPFYNNDNHEEKSFVRIAIKNKRVLNRVINIIQAVMKGK